MRYDEAHEDWDSEDDDEWEDKQHKEPSWVGAEPLDEFRFVRNRRRFAVIARG